MSKKWTLVINNISTDEVIQIARNTICNKFLSEHPNCIDYKGCPLDDICSGFRTNGKSFGLMTNKEKEKFAYELLDKAPNISFGVVKSTNSH